MVFTRTDRWQIARTRDNFATTFTVPCGEADAVPLPNDDDHDGFNDLASYVFRGPRAGTWTVCTSRSEFRELSTFRFGAAGIEPDFRSAARHAAVAISSRALESGVLKPLTFAVRAYRMRWRRRPQSARAAAP